MKSNWNDPRLQQIAWQDASPFLKEAAGGLEHWDSPRCCNRRDRVKLGGRPRCVESSGAQGTHFAAKAHRVIYIHCTGSPPHLDLLTTSRNWFARNGQDCPDSFLKGRRFAFTAGVPKLLGTPRTFTQHGPEVTWMSDAIPHFHSVADEMCVIKSMFTEQFNHAPPSYCSTPVRPVRDVPRSVTWVTYGLGSENENLPVSWY